MAILVLSLIIAKVEFVWSLRRSAPLPTNAMMREHVIQQTVYVQIQTRQTALLVMTIVNVLPAILAKLDLVSPELRRSALLPTNAMMREHVIRKTVYVQIQPWETVLLVAMAILVHFQTYA
jgi:hypothetical protein